MSSCSLSEAGTERQSNFSHPPQRKASQFIIQQNTTKGTKTKKHKHLGKIKLDPKETLSVTLAEALHLNSCKKY